MGVVGLDDDAAGFDLGMAHHLGAGQYRRAGYAGGFEDAEPLGGRFLQQGFLHHLQAFVGVAVTARRRLEALVFKPLRVAYGVAQAVPLVVGHHRDADVAVRRLVDEVDEGRGPGDVDLLANEGLAAHVRRPQEGDDGVQHGQPDVLADAGAFAGEQRRRDRLGGGDAGELVREDRPHQPRASLVGARLDGGEPR